MRALETDEIVTFANVQKTAFLKGVVGHVPHISERVSTPQLKFGTHEADPWAFRTGKKYGVPLRQNFWGLAPQNWQSLGARISGRGTDSRTVSSPFGRKTSRQKIRTENFLSGHSGMGQICDVWVHQKIDKITIFRNRSVFFPTKFLGVRGDNPAEYCAKARENMTTTLRLRGVKNFSFLGADPHMGVGIPAWHGGISSASGVLQYSVEISAKISKMGEILRGKEKHLAPPSGQTESRRPATGP